MWKLVADDITESIYKQNNEIKREVIEQWLHTFGIVK